MTARYCRTGWSWCLLTDYVKVMADVALHRFSFGFDVRFRRDDPCFTISVWPVLIQVTLWRSHWLPSSIFDDDAL